MMAGLLRAAQRRRRLMLAPSSLSPASSSGSRFSCLASDEEGKNEEEKSLRSVASRAASLVLNGDDDGWTPVRSERRKSKEGIVQQFWVDAGFPMPALRFWERDTGSPSAIRGESEVSACRSTSDGSFASAPSPAYTVEPVTPQVKETLDPAPSSRPRLWQGARVRRWSGPLPRPRTSLPAVLGMFMPPGLAPEDQALASSSAAPERSTATVGNLQEQAFPPLSRDLDRDRDKAGVCARLDSFQTDSAATGGPRMQVLRRKPLLQAQIDEMLKKDPKPLICMLPFERLTELGNNINEMEAIKDSGKNIVVDPSLELRFPFEPERDISCCLQLTNKASSFIAFNINADQNKYRAQPSRGTLPPFSKCYINLTLQAQKEAPPFMKCLDITIVQATRVAEGFTSDQIREDFFKNASSVDEVTLPIVYVALK